jgi:hypothetical protein
LGNGNPAVRFFLIALMIIGFSIVALSELDALPQISGTFDIRFPDLSTLEIISVDQDPVTGEISGNIILGKPDVSGMTWTGSPNSEGFSTGSTCPLRTTSFNALTKNYPASFGTGSFSGGCTAGFAEWSLEELPDDLTITSMVFKIKDQRWFPFLTEPSSRNCKIGIIEQPVDTITKSQLFQKFNAPDFILQDGDWCTTSGEKSFIVSQTVVDAFQRALVGDDKMTLSFAMSTLAKGTGCCWESDQTFWGTEGSWIINGFAEPISCAVGESQVGFKCEPLVCDVGEEVNGNICSPIQCAIGNELIGSICTPIECQVGEQLIGNTCSQIICPAGNLLVGNDCDPIICQDGFVLSGNECTTIVCPTGNELVGSQCQTITCPVGTFLQGNDCQPIVCSTGNTLEGNNCIAITCEIGEQLVGNICKPVECQIGERLVGNRCETIQCDSGTELIGSECLPIVCLATEDLVGNQCLPKPLDCPSGTVARENVCIQLVPTLQATGAPVSIVTIAGLSLFIIATAGFVFRAIKLKGF